MLRRFVPFVAIALTTLSACSSVPSQIQTAPANDIQLQQVNLDVASQQGQYVRWGGQVVSIENTADATLIQIVQYPLNHFGRPITNRNSQGRFLARTPEFIDPIVYPAGTLLTFTGSINGSADRKVDQRSLTLPIVDIESMHNWPPIQQLVHRSPYYYDPFFSPYYRFHGSYWHHPRYRYRYWY